MNQKKIWLSLFIFLGICFFVQILGSFWTGFGIREDSSIWYSKLNKPFWTPPNWLFGPVWFCLYITIAIGGWWIYLAKDAKYRTICLFFYFVQLGLNLIWSLLFFYLQNPTFAMLDILLLNIFIALTMITASKVDKKVSYLLIPYLIWTLYASSLNIGIWYLN